jgi:hypothetical protein
MRLVSAASPTVNAAATIVTPTSGTVSYSWQAGDTAATGIYACVFVVTFGDGSTYTYPNDGYLEVSIEQNLTAAGTQTLVSLGEARDTLNFMSSDKSNDAKLLRFVRAVTPTIEMICGPVLETQYEEWHPGGHYSVIVNRRPSSGYGTSPIFEVQAVSEYNGPIEWPLAIIASPDQGQLYSVMPDPTFPGRIIRRTAGGGIQAFPSGEQQVHVVYTAGQSSVPDNVAEGTLELIRLHFTATQQGRPRLGGNNAYLDDDTEPGRVVLGYFVPNRVREMLMPNRRYPAIA